MRKGPLMLKRISLKTCARKNKCFHHGNLQRLRFWISTFLDRWLSTSIPLLFWCASVLSLGRCQHTWLKVRWKSLAKLGGAVVLPKMLFWSFLPVDYFDQINDLNIHWASKETYHFFRATLTKIHGIKISHSYDSPYEAHLKNQRVVFAKKEKNAMKSQ